MKQVVKNIFIILNAPEKRKFCLLAIADIIISILDIAFLIALLYVINFYTQTGNGTSFKYFLLEIFNAYPLLLIIFFFIFFALKNVSGFLVSKMQYRFVYDVASRISRENLSQYLNGNYTNYVNIDSSIANRKISQEPIEFAHYVLNGVQQVFSQSVLILITITAVVIFNPLFFPLLVLMLAPPVFLIGFLMKRKLNASGVHGKKTGEQTIQHLQEALSGYVESNVYKKNDFFIDRYHRLQVRLNQYLSGRLIIQNMPPRLIEVFAVFGLLILVLVHFFTLRSNSIPLVTIGALMVAAYKIIPGIVKITNIAGQVKTYSFAAADLAAIPHLEVIDDYSNTPIESIIFENVCFNYADKNALSSFSLSMQKGDFAVVSGVSGKGKTTFVNLLLGFLTPSSGKIFINGAVTEVETRQLFWNRLAYIKQQAFFLHASIIENITLQESNYDETKIKKIIAITGVDKIVCTLPQSLDTIITENGKNFSGGQRQRIICARALYTDADLLVLDEPFNELDELSEIDMLKELQKIAADGKMIILITHNKAAIPFGNRKILLDEQ
ncbi:MAG: ABC transporter ATP-binding protein [Bacteroidota bacterium]